MARRGYRPGVGSWTADVHHGRVLRRVLATAVLVSAVAACSSDGATGSTDSSARCEVGSWRSTLVTVPAQANIDQYVPGAGGNGIDIRFGADGSFFVDFGPMQPATGTFVISGQTGTLAAVWKGVGEGTWTADDAGAVSASFADLTTASASASLTLGTTTPPLFDYTLQRITDDMLFGDDRMGDHAVTECTGDRLVMSTPYPGGTAVVEAERV